MWMLVVTTVRVIYVFCGMQGTEQVRCICWLEAQLKHNRNIITLKTKTTKNKNTGPPRGSLTKFGQRQKCMLNMIKDLPVGEVKACYRCFHTHRCLQWLLWWRLFIVWSLSLLLWLFRPQREQKMFAQKMNLWLPFFWC